MSDQFFKYEEARMKGILLAGGSGSRLYPMSITVNKHLMPVCNKPLIYYSLSNLMLAGIKEILLISSSQAIASFQTLLGDGSKWGIHLEYAAQESPRGIAEAFIIGEKFIGNSTVCLALGDNFFYGFGFSSMLKAGTTLEQGACVFACLVDNPSRYGVIEFNSAGKPMSLEEKPLHPKTNYVVPGIYFYDHHCVEIAKTITPSKRGELEITTVNEEYMRQDLLRVQNLGRGIAWMDTGTPKDLLDTANFVETIESRQGLKIGCPEEIAYRSGYISQSALQSLIEVMPTSDYREYLSKCAVQPPY